MFERNSPLQQGQNMDDSVKFNVILQD